MKDTHGEDSNDIYACSGETHNKSLDKFVAGFVFTTGSLSNNSDLVYQIP